MTKVLIVGGTFNIKGGKPSSVINSIYNEIAVKPDYEVDLYNGGLVTDLHERILPEVANYKVVLWFASVPNTEEKVRDVKAINPKAILITSKRNDNKYLFTDLISRALANKANLTVEFSKDSEGLFKMMLFDPLGNVFYDGFEVPELCNKLIARVKELQAFTRMPSIQDTENEVPAVPDEAEFFDFAHSCADIFHNLIGPAKGTERFLGNMSFRCQNGFPSFRGENGIVYVSRRNVDKSDINAGSFVPTYLDESMATRYFGENKPSVDTPVQLRLYKLFPWANYMLHAHCYIDIQEEFEGVMSFSTNKLIPCGAIEEVQEIVDHYTFWESYWKAIHNNEAPRLLAINLTGHGCILIAKDVEVFAELQKHKNNCFVQRPMPEVV